MSSVVINSTVADPDSILREWELGWGGGGWEEGGGVGGGGGGRRQSK